jgi:hypothetical protein
MLAALNDRARRKEAFAEVTPLCAHDGLERSKPAAVFFED